MAKPLEFYIATALGLDPNQCQKGSLTVEFHGPYAFIKWTCLQDMEITRFSEAMRKAELAYDEAKNED